MRIVLILSVILALTVSAGADHCTTYSTASPELDLDPSPAPGPRFYWDNDPCQPCMWSTWVYQESNGIDGLQRGDEVQDDTCHGMIESDTVVF